MQNDSPSVICGDFSFSVIKKNIKTFNQIILRTLMVEPAHLKGWQRVMSKGPFTSDDLLRIYEQRPQEPIQMAVRFSVFRYPYAQEEMKHRK